MERFYITYSAVVMGKTSVTVTEEHNESGLTKPLFLTWMDGRKYEIDKVTDVRQAPSLRGGGRLAYSAIWHGSTAWQFEKEQLRHADTKSGLSKTKSRFRGGLESSQK